MTRRRLTVGQSTYPRPAIPHLHVTPPPPPAHRCRTPGLGLTLWTRSLSLNVTNPSGGWTGSVVMAYMANRGSWRVSLEHVVVLAVRVPHQRLWTYRDGVTTVTHEDH